ncbi:MAG: hypothetical protein RL660_3095 [Bacteroidota bacterium]|jgi:opacity protein-like surface antigen
MKKIVFALTGIALLACTNVEAQNKTAESISKKYRFALFGNIGTSGLKATSATVTNDSIIYDIKKDGGRFSSGIGVAVELPLTESATLASGLGVDWYGGTLDAKRKATSVSEQHNYAKDANIEYKLQSVNIPISLRLKASNINDKMFIFGRVGGDLGFVIGRNADYSITGSRSLGTDTVIAGTGKLSAKTVTPIQFGWHFGAGVEYKIAKNAVFGEILYRNNLLDATLPQFRDVALYKFNDGNVRSNNISLRIGYFF